MARGRGNSSSAAAAALGAGGPSHPKRRRTRKGRTAAAAMESSSSSSSSSASSSSAASDGEGDGQNTSSLPASKAERMRLARLMELDSSDEDESDNSDSSPSASTSGTSRAGSSSLGVRGRSRKRRTASRDNRQSSDEADKDKDKDEDEDKEGDEQGVQRARELYTPPPEPALSFEDVIAPSHNKRSPSHLSQALTGMQPVRAEPPRGVLGELAEERQNALARRKQFEAHMQRGGMSSTGPTLSDPSQRQAREEAFTSVWMRTMVDEFGEELDALRKRDSTLAGGDGGPNSSSRMPLLIDALQSGAELYSRGRRDAPSTASSSMASQIPSAFYDVDEVALLLGHCTAP